MECLLAWSLRPGEARYIKRGRDLQDANRNVRARVNKPHNPGILIAGRLVLGVECGITEVARVGDSQDLGEGEIRAVGTYTISGQP